MYLSLSLTRRASGTSTLPGTKAAHHPLFAFAMEGAHQNHGFACRGRGWRSIWVASALSAPFPLHRVREWCSVRSRYELEVEKN